jgi:type I restriction-modification system DNA methylase subunit
LSGELQGFDAILGNPPYISTHTSSEERWRSVIERRFGYFDDLYVHFTDLSFSLLRQGGTFGFIVSDTFFTLNSKLWMRKLLQKNRLEILGQCNPFEATVDASIIVAQKKEASDDEQVLFIQARRDSGSGQPERDLPRLALRFGSETQDFQVSHGSEGSLRFHMAPIGIYRKAHKSNSSSNRIPQR